MQCFQELLCNFLKTRYFRATTELLNSLFDGLFKIGNPEYYRKKIKIIFIIPGMVAINLLVY